MAGTDFAANLADVVDAGFGTDFLADSKFGAGCCGPFGHFYSAENSAH